MLNIKFQQSFMRVNSIFNLTSNIFINYVIKQILQHVSPFRITSDLTLASFKLNW